MSSKIFPLFRRLSARHELGFYAECTEPLNAHQLAVLRWLVTETFEPQRTTDQPGHPHGIAMEVGPRLAMETAFSSNATAICKSLGLPVVRMEQTRRYLMDMGQRGAPPGFHLDRMTEQLHPGGITTFATGATPAPVAEVSIIGRPIEELRAIDRHYGTGMDDGFLLYYQGVFTRMGRNPTDVEWVDLGNKNSDHSRHTVWTSVFEIDGEPMPESLFQLVKRPLSLLGEGNSTLLGFRDNGGVNRGFTTVILLPKYPGLPSPMVPTQVTVHITATAETHNHPSMIEPFQGGATGGGGRKRDGGSVGRGSTLGYGLAGYSVGNLFMLGHLIFGEVEGRRKPSAYASPLQVLLRASDGVTWYANCFGEPCIGGYTRTFGQRIGTEWVEFRKPIVYTAGIGSINDQDVVKGEAEVGMLIVQIGGPAFPVGVGGGAASSLEGGTNTVALDFASVQRGNPMVQNGPNRVIRTCTALQAENPIVAIHDQGAGGPGNVLTELIEKLGGTIEIRKIVLGDKTMSVLAIWVGEYQERYAFLIRPERIAQFQSICDREGVTCEVLGTVDGSGKVVVTDSRDHTTPVNLALEDVFGSLPRKTFRFSRKKRTLTPLKLWPVSVRVMLQRVLRLPSVGSKGFLVHKGDRSVTGLVVRQQCCGIAQIAISDYAMNRQGYVGLTGSVSAIGEQPIKMLVDPAAGARMSLGEMITNMAGARISSFDDIRIRGNWMWAAKQPSEGPRLYDAVLASRDFMEALGIAEDGGKDSSSMAARVSGETLTAPGTVVALGYAPVPDVRQCLTPDIKRPGSSVLMLVDLGNGKNRLGGSALAQSFNQLGDDCPDVENPAQLKAAFLAVQQLMAEQCILSLHDRSDGGLVTAVTEMCMASRCGFNLRWAGVGSSVPYLFSEELGLVLELAPEQVAHVTEVFASCGVPISVIGETVADRRCTVRSGANGRVILDTTIEDLRTWWESTSAALDELQVPPALAKQEYASYGRVLPQAADAPSYHLTFTPGQPPPYLVGKAGSPRVAVVRADGSNGEREMLAALTVCGFESWDVNMRDLTSGAVTLDSFRGVVFPGGFSNMDVFGSAKGWAGGIIWNERLREMFDRFYAREDTFSLGVCNGCQLMALLGWVPYRGIEVTAQPRFVHNLSGRFESRWVQLVVQPSPSILFSGMEGSKLGAWVAHGEGRLVFPDASVQQRVLSENLVSLSYLDPFGQVTEQYPYNPNGSSRGMTGLCSPDGRHNAMMPHTVDRGFLTTQWPWMPPEWSQYEVAPWLKMFQNARTWCER